MPSWRGNATLVVAGLLTVAPDVEPCLLFDRLSRVHNVGEIVCTQEQMGALQARLGLDEGQFRTPEGKDKEEEEESAPGAIGNVGYLKL